MYISIDLAILLGIYSMDIIIKVCLNVHENTGSYNHLRTPFTFKSQIIQYVYQTYVFACIYVNIIALKMFWKKTDYSGYF